MRKSIVLVGLMLVSAVMFAQRKVDPMERAAKQAEKMKTELSLDDVQYKAIKAINEEYAEKQTRIMKDSAVAKEAKRSQLKSLHQEKKTAVDKVLTDEQRSKWTTHQSARQKKGRAHMARHNGDHAQRMQKNLSLSDDQTSKIKAIDKEFAEKFRALRSDSAIAREEARAKAKQLREEYISKTKAVLTEEQFKAWQEQKADRKRRKS
jgi:Spy/CpxP family protein refolding chaperone